MYTRVAYKLLMSMWGDKVVNTYHGMALYECPHCGSAVSNKAKHDNVCIATFTPDNGGLI
jgi:hypothetical protein